MRFLFPVYFIPEVEIFRTRDTSMGTIDKSTYSTLIFAGWWQCVIQKVCAFSVVQAFLESVGKVIYFRHSETSPLVLTVEQVDERRYAAQLRGTCFSRAPTFGGLPTASVSSAWTMQRDAAGYQLNAPAISNQSALHNNMMLLSDSAVPHGYEYSGNAFDYRSSTTGSSVNSSLNATATTNLSTLVNVPTQQECVICCDAPRDCTFVPCGHIAVCHACAQVLHFRREPCPICRNVIHNVMKVYSP